MMTHGKRKEFTFHAYYNPRDGTTELRQIGSLRPPNELITEATDYLSNVLTESDLQFDTTKPIYLGKVFAAFIYVPGEPEKNQLDKSSFSFNEIMREEQNGQKVGDPVTGEYKQRSYTSNPENTYKPYQNKGWLTLNGDYYPPSENKPNGWSS